MNNTRPRLFGGRHETAEGWSNEVIARRQEDTTTDDD